MKLNEIFYAIQGEGPFIGKPTIFIRLSGCNLACDFCDTKYHTESHNIPLNQLEHLVKQLPGNHITLTGGEPTLQDDEVYELINRLDYKTAVETNGTILTKVPYDDIIISPKKQGIDKNILKEYDKLKLHLSSPNIYFKFVYENKNELWWEELGTAKDRTYIMPEGADRETQLKRMPEVMDYCLEKGYNFSPRLQVLGFNTERRK